MKTLFLHIGLGKTGSSALQSWMSLNIERLREQGIYYADLAPEAKLGDVSSGNGVALFRAVRAGDLAEAERLLRSVYFCGGEKQKALVSCELLQDLQRPRVQEIKRICDRLEIEVRVIVYVRSIYESAYSSYLQSIKRGKTTHSFGHPSDIVPTQTSDRLLNYFIPFRDGISVLNYDAVKSNLYGSFASVIEIDTTGFTLPDKKVNRSLSIAEAEVLRRINELHEGAFSRAVSDYLLRLSPDLSPVVYYEQSLVERVREESESELDWINQQFDVQPPLDSDFFVGSPSAPPGALEEQHIQTVITWAMEFAPPEGQQLRFVEFLFRLAEFAREQGLQAAGDRLEQRAMAMGGILPEELTDRPQAPGDKFAVAHYMITYFPARLEQDSEKARQCVDRLREWVQQLVTPSIGSAFNTLSHTVSMGPGSEQNDGSDASMTAFTIVEGFSLVAIQQIARSCPLLDYGGRVEVSQIQSVPRAGARFA